MTFHSNLKYKFYFTIRNWMNSNIKPFATYHFEFFFRPQTRIIKTQTNQRIKKCLRQKQYH